MVSRASYDHAGYILLAKILPLFHLTGQRSKHICSAIPFFKHFPVSPEAYIVDGVAVAVQETVFKVNKSNFKGFYPMCQGRMT